MGVLKGGLTKLAKENSKVRVEDLSKLFDSQLSQQSQLWGFLFGAVFGGILTAALATGIQWLTTFNLFSQPVEQTVVIFIVALGLVVGIESAFSTASRTALKFKIRLMKDYLEAREIVEQRKVAMS